MLRAEDLLTEPFVDELYATYWEKQPFVVRGGAKLLGQSVSRASFLRLAKQLELAKPHLVTRQWNGVVHANDMCNVSSEMHERCLFLKRHLRYPGARLWIDGTLTTFRNTGVGLHFDDKNNFVLQQTGTKRWQLYSPSYLTAQQKRDKLLADPDVLVDIRAFADRWVPTFEATLGPGDLLYLPILWPHFGISDGRSVSLSLVLPPDTPPYRHPMTVTGVAVESPPGSPSPLRRTARFLRRRAGPPAWKRLLQSAYV